MRIVKNPDRKIYDEVTEAVKKNNGHCPCLVERNEDTKCPCAEFLRQETEGYCRCGRYYKKL
jgi:hypothetical protein